MDIKIEKEIVVTLLMTIKEARFLRGIVQARPLSPELEIEDEKEVRDKIYYALIDV